MLIEVPFVKYPSRISPSFRSAVDLSKHNQSLLFHHYIQWNIPFGDPKVRNIQALTHTQNCCLLELLNALNFFNNFLHLRIRKSIEVINKTRQQWFKEILCNYTIQSRNDRWFPREWIKGRVANLITYRLIKRDRITQKRNGLTMYRLMSSNG